MIDAHHHLWDLGAVDYPWLMAQGAVRFFGDPAPIQRDYMIDEYRRDAQGFNGSVHIQVGAADSWREALWVQNVADATPEWQMAQVAFADLTAPDLAFHLDRLQTLPTLRGVRQIVGRAAGEDAATGTNTLLDDPAFVSGLQEIGRRGLSFDMQLTPGLIERTATVLAQAPDTAVALCHAGSPQDRTAAGLLDWATRLRHLAALPHVTCKLSGLGMFDHTWTVDRFRPIVDTCLDLFGPKRCMFGSNFPVDSLYSDYARLLDAYKTLIPEAHHPQVFNATARAFYGLQRTEESA
jgi:predicted TIM-barrel fold metal-dependent hydrolase